MLGLRRFHSLVRGVSNHGAAPSFETGATRRLRFSGSTRTCALLRMRRINGQHLVIPIHFQRDAGGKTHVQTQVMSQNSL